MADPGITASNSHDNSEPPNAGPLDTNRSLGSAVNGVIHNVVVGRWSALPGGKPTTWSAHRTAGVKAADRSTRAKEPPIAQCFNGEILVEKFRRGELYAYPLAHRRVVADEGGELRPGECLPKKAKAAWKWRAIHERALAIIVTAHLVCQTQGLVIRQADFATLLGVHRDTANRVLHELVQWRFIASHPRRKEVDLEPAADGTPRCGHHRLANRYTVTDHAIAYWSITPRRGRKSSRTLRTEKPTAKASVPTVLISESTTCATEPPAAAIDVSPAVPATDVPDETPVLDSDANRVKTRPATVSEARDRDTRPPRPLQPPVDCERDDLDEGEYRRMIADWPTELRLGALSALEAKRGGVS